MQYLWWWWNQHTSIPVKYLRSTKCMVSTRLHTFSRGDFRNESCIGGNWKASGNTALTAREPFLLMPSTETGKAVRDRFPSLQCDPTDNLTKSTCSMELTQATVNTSPGIVCLAKHISCFFLLLGQCLRFYHNQLICKVRKCSLLNFVLLFKTRKVH